MKKIAFIINPKSGTKSKESLPELIEKNLDKEKFEPKIVYTQYAGHGKELAQQLSAEGYDVVVACGGDGTANEIASAIVHTNTALAIVPLGSGNGLGRHLGYSMSPSKALQQINEANEEHIDYAKANDRCFFCTCGTGFDAHVSHSFSNQKTRGLMTYIKTMCREYWNYKPYNYVIKANSMAVLQKAFLITIANAAQWGNNAYIAPEANIADGKLNVCILKPFTMFAIPAIIAQLMTKNLLKSRYFTFVEATDITLCREESGEFHIDGEPVLEEKDIHIRIIHHGLKVMMPKHDNKFFLNKVIDNL